jgi:hypothetical protein
MGKFDNKLGVFDVTYTLSYCRIGNDFIAQAPRVPAIRAKTDVNHSGSNDLQHLVEKIK